MIAATHLAAGAASSLIIQRVVLSNSEFQKAFAAFLAGIASHLILDFSPHQEYAVEGMWLGIILLTEISAVFLCVFSPAKGLMFNLVIFAGITGGALPDFIELVRQYFLNWPWLAYASQTIHFFHFQPPSFFLISFSIQVLIAITAVIFVRHKSV